ncbi:MAG: type II toxin-antitoxin system prevent-host-death family antitoxin [Acidobacteriota bacterium]
MKTAAIRQVQHHLSEVLEWVTAGETVEITRRGRAVARLVPPDFDLPRIHWPNLMARLEEDFPEGIPPGVPGSHLLMEGRGGR